MTSRTSAAPVAFRLNPLEEKLLAEAQALLDELGVGVLEQIDAAQREPAGTGRPAQARSLILRRSLAFGLPLVIKELRLIQSEQAQPKTEEEP